MSHKFYTTLQYPIPTHSELYLYIDEIKEKDHSIASTESKAKEKISRDQVCDLLPEYLQYITKRGWLYRSLPFVKQIYLCNSITFNALHPNSDIDLTIITSSRYLRRARFWSVLLFFCTGIKRSLHNKKMKFCLTFYIDEKHSNIYHLRQNQGDIYLPYRLAHGVLLYTDESLPNDYIRTHNKELLQYLPNHPLHQTINLGSPLITGSSRGKKILQILLANKIGRIVQYILAAIRKKFLKYKTSKLSRKQQQDIIVSDTMLKFHDDKRPLFQFRAKNNNHKGLSQG